MSFLGQLQQESWYPQVAQIFANANVPAALWESTIAVEDPSLDPNAHNYNPATGDNSYGLFQTNLYGSLAADPARVSAAFGGPQAQATWAAAKMSAALANVDPNAPLSVQLQAIENAGWPGNLSEDAQRQSALAQITGGSSSVPGQGGLAADSGTNPNPSNPFPALQNPLGGVSDAITAFGQNIDQLVFNLSAGALFLALIAGGFAILAAPSLEKGAKVAAKGAELAA